MRGFILPIIVLRNLGKKYNSLKIGSLQFLLDLVTFICWKNLKHRRYSVNNHLLDGWKGDEEKSSNWPL